MPLSFALYPMTSDLGRSHRQKRQTRMQGAAIAGEPVLSAANGFPLSGIPARKEPSGRCPYASTSPAGTRQ